MIIGIPKEIKAQENRVGMTPAGVDVLVKAGHQVIIETKAGEGSGLSDSEYAAAGAQIASSNIEVYQKADMIVKVKEPIASEYELFKEGQILFAYLHLAPDPEQLRALLKAKIIGIAYETVTVNGGLPLLLPMSEVAGRMSVQVGADLLCKHNDGRGILMGGVPGVEPAHVVIVGGGTVGTGAARIAVGMGARVTLLDVSVQRLAFLSDQFRGRVVTLMSNSYNIAKAVADADLLLGAVLVPGARTPVLVSEEMVKTMRPGSVIVDVAIDQGGSVETIDRITTHSDPYYIKHGVVHYSVANMPGAVPRTSTFALTNATTPYVLDIANKGAEAALRESPALMAGLNVYKGKVACKAVAEAQGCEYQCPEL